MAEIQSSGGWVEVVAPGVKTTLDQSTMPHQLISKADGTFTFEPVAWEKRSVGDDVTNPVPSFVGNRINDIFFTRNRLGFLTTENVVMSRAGGEYFNFGRETVTDVLDTDPIDLAAAESDLSILTEALPFDEDIVIFSPRTQFRLTSDREIFSPKTVKMRAVSRYDNYSACVPISSGNSITFAVSHGAYAGIMEFTISDTGADAQDVTEHVPRYIPGNARKTLRCTSEGMTLVLSDTDTRAIYVYSQYARGGERLQAAWSRWSFGDVDQIVDADVFATDLVMLIQRPDGLYLETINLAHGTNDPGGNSVIHLDRRESESGVQRTYNAASGQTLITLPWTYDTAADRPLQMWERLSASDTNLPQEIPHTTISPTVIAVTGDWTNRAFYVGIWFSSYYTFSTQYLRMEGNARTDGRLQLRRFHALYARTCAFAAEVTYATPSRNTAGGGGSNPTTPGGGSGGRLLVDSDSYLLIGAESGLLVDYAASISDVSTFASVASFETSTRVRSYPMVASVANAQGRFAWPIHSKSENVSVTLHSIGALPFGILSAGWEAGFTARAQKV